MSNALAIAGVTAALRDLLNDGQADFDLPPRTGGVVRVSALPPDRAQEREGDGSQLNLFLYQVTPNAGWRNVGLPSRDGDGARVGNPPLALDLHYLLSAYSPNDQHAELLLGYAMQVLHETPVLTRATLRRALQPPGPPIPDAHLPVPQGVLPAPFSGPAAALADQAEQVRITWEPLTLEEVTKIFTAAQAHLRLSVGYLATVVILQRERPVRPTLPVRERRLHVAPRRPPRLERVEPATVAAAPDAELVLHGTNLAGPDVRVVFAGAEPVAPRPGATDQRLVARLPATLLAGPGVVSVRRGHDLGTNREPHFGEESNALAFLLLPVATVVAHATEPDAGPGRHRVRVVVSLRPTPVDGQRLRVVLGEPEPPVGRDARAYVAAAPVAGRDDELGPDLAERARRRVFALSGVEAGTYAVRVEVDGAPSPTTADTAGRITAPLLTVP